MADSTNPAVSPPDKLRDGVKALLLRVAARLDRSDVTAARRSEEASGSADAVAGALVGAMPHPAFLLARAGTVSHANARAARLFPATRPGDPFTLTFRRPDFAEAIEAAAAGRPASLEFREPGAAATLYAVTLNPLQAAGAEGSVLVTFEDLSDRVAIARMRADFVANASHELRTPLASLTGFIETLLGPARSDPVASERFLKVMLEQARRMRRLIDDLLSLSRVEMRAHTRPTARVDLSAVVSHVGDAMQPLARENGVELVVTAPADTLDVTGDRDELVQLAQNLVENAIRYGASGGRVELTLTARPKGRAEASLSVRDQGPGIAAEHLPRLTERFYRVEEGSDTKGTGLGLSIVKHIATRHQGQLAIASTPGDGATFTVTLPLAG